MPHDQEPMGRLPSSSNTGIRCDVGQEAPICLQARTRVHIAPARKGQLLIVGGMGCSAGQTAHHIAQRHTLQEVGKGSRPGGGFCVSAVRRLAPEPVRMDQQGELSAAMSDGGDTCCWRSQPSTAESGESLVSLTLGASIPIVGIEVFHHPKTLVFWTDQSQQDQGQGFPGAPPWSGCDMWTSTRADTSALEKQLEEGSWFESSESKVESPVHERGVDLADTPCE